MPAPHRPTLRSLQIQETTQDGRSGIVLSDPLELAKGPIFVPDGLLPIVGRLDGTRTVEEIEAEIESGARQKLPDDLVSGLIDQLDEMLFLDGDRFRAALAEAERSFAEESVRPHAHAGITAGYPSDPEALRDALDSMVRRPETDDSRSPSPRGLVAPHIDLARGREGYAIAYSALAECEPADVYVVFGTGHQGPQAPVTGLSMDWQTPLGHVRTNRELVDAIHGRLGAPHPTDVLLHRNEHSLEFQMLFLAHVLGDHEFEVAGFLTGHLANGHGSIDDEPHVQALLEAFTEECDRIGKRVCFVAGADLAHIGPFFGDPSPVDTTRLEQLTFDEQQRLAHLERGDPARFYSSIEAPGNPDRVCGTTPMYLTARLAGGAGRLLHYGQATADDGHQTVSYCGMLFE